MSDVSFDTQPKGPFLGMYVEEDMGLKMTLEGIKVTDLNAPDKHPRPVPVWFLNPEREERRITYPSITVNFLSERVAHEREHRGYVQVGYEFLQNVPFPEPVGMEYPIPMDFDYQITTHARINSHISQMNAALMLGPLHPRFGFVLCPGGTVRRLEVLAMSTANGTEADKRLFRHIYRVRIPSEVEAAVGISTVKVKQVLLRIYDKVSGQEVYGPPPRATGSTAGPPLYDKSLGAQYASQTAGD